MSDLLYFYRISVADLVIKDESQESQTFKNLILFLLFLRSKSETIYQRFN